MAITLEQAKVGMADKVDQQIVDMFRRSSLLLDRMTFDNAISPGTGGSTLVYGYTQLKTPSTAAVRAIIEKIDDLCLGYKLPGAGGGGFLYMMAKDEEAAARIRKILVQEAVNDRARFVEMSLSEKGLEVSRS